MTHNPPLTPCFHCGLSVPEGLDIQVNINGNNEAMCCYGCQAVAQSIINSGMGDFYKFRTMRSQKAREVVPEFLQQLKAYDNPQVQKQFISEKSELTGDEQVREVSLILEGIVCAACIWLNEQHLNALPGVISANINYSNNRARVRWDNNRISLSEILESITRIGYLAHPYNPDRQQAVIEKEKKQQLRRIGIAAVLGMQIMILAVALYTGGWWGMEEPFRQLFRWVSLGVTVPLLLFASSPFFSAALRDLKNKRVGMDVPVALGIGIAFSASVLHTFQGSGEIYFDSVAMFTFFLLSARYFESGARKRTAEATEALLNLQPAIATKLIVDSDGGYDHQKQLNLSVAELAIGDYVLVRPGEHIPVDGTIIEGTSGINESLLTGESLPVIKTVNDSVIGGSTNTESPLVVKIDKIGDDTVLASIQRLLEEAQNRKPTIAKMADRLASKFVAIILLLAGGVAVYWYQTDPAHWVAITVATLVVTCPCALSLATPAAFTAASGQLAKLGLLPTSATALETLSRATDFVFDKTGTLTQGNIRLVKAVSLTDDDIEHHLHIAAALEAGSEHPVARSLIQAAGETTQVRPSIKVSQLDNKAGAGVHGVIEGTQWYLGNVNYIHQICAQSISSTLLAEHQISAMTLVALATETKIVAVFAFDDELREEASALIRKLKQQNKTITLMTGDNEASARRIASQVGIDNVYANMKPADKLARVQSMQQRGAIVAMTGDGINDAPVLAGADVSIAMGSGTQLAAAHADLILLSNHVEHLYAGYLISRRTLKIIRQNLSWAFGYNLLAIPAAATGHVDPWMAAIGMSASSLLVVLNALRLTRS
ncbi:MAG: heavy metal translocating P-type ATPase [Gammaproteobacteria bacterium]|nr:heavy metal translocating P-type ATPase [Gammaproteobacteria bacterium]